MCFSYVKWRVGVGLVGCRRGGFGRRRWRVCGWGSPTPRRSPSRRRDSARQSSIAHILSSYCAAHPTARRCPSVVAATVTDPRSAPAGSTATIVWLFLWASVPNTTIIGTDSSPCEGCCQDRSVGTPQCRPGGHSPIKPRRPVRRARRVAKHSTSHTTGGHRYGEPTRQAPPARH